jgi:hypothetical protein
MNLNIVGILFGHVANEYDVFAISEVDIGIEYISESEALFEEFMFNPEHGEKSLVIG